MSIFNNENPFTQGALPYATSMTLQRVQDDRESDRTAKVKVTDLANFLGCEPQLVQRLTENLVLIDDMALMQKSPWRISTEDKTLQPKKGYYIRDNVSLKSYRILAYYPHKRGFDFTVTELND